ncbi:MAG TPA: phosphate signaling complex protein PhoU [Candidatus Gallibacteroides avistercoris]|uniref:Phosphate-specific transport system accessory protein PhoU n=1 Tax=Candidatus Gallibacteroides avistercoris TaxID=2840833 RepID=A0A9D1SD74_9BACT|nr:phosphate signaling complex protein PhoU [Candidatus Gallibacteroides avistercoris]
MKYIENELDGLKREILEMWSLVDSQLNRAGEALLSLDRELAKEVVYREKRVNAFELKIDSDCEDIIALYAPVAVDLRFVLAVLKINTNLERIADFCEGIAQFVLKYPSISIDAELFDKARIRTMLSIVKEMLQSGKEALEEEKSSLAVSIFEKDSQVDELNHGATGIIADYLQQYPDRAAECLNLIGIIRKMERIGDHCNNMAEEIVFYLDAKVLKHSSLPEDQAVR